MYTRFDLPIAMSMKANGFTDIYVYICICIHRITNIYTNVCKNKCAHAHIRPADSQVYMYGYLCVRVCLYAYLCTL